jgi:ABC-type transporter Mla subunit MlaD
MSSQLLRRTLAVAAIVVVAVVAVAIVGIAFGGEEGSATKAEYQATVVTTRDRVDFALERITKSTSVDELIEQIDAASTAVGSAAEDLDRAGVATGFSDQNDALVNTLRAFSDELGNTAAQFRDPTFAPNLAGINSLSFTQWTVVNRILADLDEKGIHVQLLVRH